MKPVPDYSLSEKPGAECDAPDLVLLDAHLDPAVAALAATLWTNAPTIFVSNHEGIETVLFRLRKLLQMD